LFSRKRSVQKNEFRAKNDEFRAKNDDFSAKKRKTSTKPDVDHTLQYCLLPLGGGVVPNFRKKSNQFQMQNYFLLQLTVGLMGMERAYMKWVRTSVVKQDKAGCCALISLVSSVLIFNFLCIFLKNT
jgi:hypothetical protein